MVVEMEEVFIYLVFVKLVNFGLSVGISKVMNKKELVDVMIEVFLYDCCVVVE